MTYKIEKNENRLKIENTIELNTRSIGIDNMLPGVGVVPILNKTLKMGLVI